MQKKKTNGITLIALVITIIVLLILAGVAIATLAGDNGILTKAVQAKDATRGGEVKDYVRMAVIENAMADSTNGTKRTRAEVISELSTQGKLTAEDEPIVKVTNSRAYKMLFEDVDDSGYWLDWRSVGGLDNAVCFIVNSVNGSCVGDEASYGYFQRPNGEKYNIKVSSWGLFCSGLGGLEWTISSRRTSCNKSKT